MGNELVIAVQIQGHCRSLQKFVNMLSSGLMDFKIVGLIRNAQTVAVVRAISCITC